MMLLINWFKLLEGVESLIKVTKRNAIDFGFFGIKVTIERVFNRFNTIIFS
jgi:hypothetical protein